VNAGITVAARHLPARLLPIARVTRRPGFLSRATGRTYAGLIRQLISYNKLQSEIAGKGRMSASDTIVA